MRAKIPAQAQRRRLDAPTTRLLTVDEAASYCGVSAPTFKAHVRIAPLKIGSAVRYDVRSIDNWIDRNSPDKTLTDEEWLAKLD